MLSSPDTAPPSPETGPPSPETGPPSPETGPSSPETGPPSPETGPSSSEAASATAWRAVPDLILRHAGYPVEDLAGLADPAVPEAAAALLTAVGRAEDASAALRAALRAYAVPERGPAGSVIAQYRALAPELAGRVRAVLTAARPAAGDLVDEYASAVRGLDAALEDLQDVHAATLARGRRHVARLFTEPWRQQVLLLSNDAAYAAFADWLSSRGAAAPDDLRGRKMADLLCMYLQRISTKNESHAHFGPFALGRFALGRFDADTDTDTDTDTDDSDGDGDSGGGMRWRVREGVERFAFLSHWAATELARAAALRSGVDAVRPRVDPLVFADGPLVNRFAFVDAPGTPFPWRLERLGTHRLTDELRWLLARVDGERTIARLRELWGARWASLPFGPALDRLAELGLVHRAPELPSGVADTAGLLPKVIAELGAGTESAEQVRALLQRFEVAGPGRRVTLLTELKEVFTREVGEQPTRHPGRHYADRSVLYEDCVSRVADVVAGPVVHRFVTDELSVVYDCLLLGSRIRMARERPLLADWLRESFGARASAVPLGEVYDRFVADRESLARRCSIVDAEVAVARRRVADVLLAGWDGTSPEASLPLAAVRDVLAEYPAAPGAVCNPDVMLGAAGPEGFASGDFFGVVGDAHAVRDLLTHGPFAPFLQRRAPGVVDDVLAGYRSIVDADEVLVDVVRAHTSKVSVQLDLPIPQMEVAGRSGRARAELLRPESLYLSVADGDVRLCCRELPGRRLRLLTSISGASSIRYDPLAVFCFPRSLGGGALAGLDNPYLPRVRVGRVVLTRRRWLLPLAELGGPTLPRRWASPDARDFTAAAALRQRHGIPQHVFAKFPREPKPLYVDWSAPLLVRQFFRMVRGAGSTDTVEVSEMLPAPDHLWLTLDGGHHTSELRCTVFSPAGTAPAKSPPTGSPPPAESPPTGSPPPAGRVPS